jgi:hypothetical protein
MTKRITDSQILGELGETAIKKLVLEMQFIYDPRGRLEAGTDGIIELRDPNSGAPLGKLLGVQVKATGSSYSNGLWRVARYPGRKTLGVFLQYMAR